MNISDNYQELITPEAIAAAVAECGEAWKNPVIPARQFDMVVRSEMEKLRRGEPVAPFVALVKLLRALPGTEPLTLLDAGASSGFYWEVLEQAGLNTRLQYTGMDFSPAFQAFAQKRYPGMRFDVGDAAAMPYDNSAFDIVLSSAVLMHCTNYEKVISEAVRVAKRYVVFHRTPVQDSVTQFFVKDAYGIPCVELHFNELELRELFDRYGLTLLAKTDVFYDTNKGFGHRSFLFVKDPVFHIPA